MKIEIKNKIKDNKKKLLKLKKQLSTINNNIQLNKKKEYLLQTIIIG